MEDTKAAWTPIARSTLEGVARNYNSTISYSDLAEEVQCRSGIRTRMLMHYWIGDVLGRVARDCYANGQPLLSALCVHQDGTVGDGYAWALGETYGDAPADLDMHAAKERLKCYRHFGASLPPDGGKPALTPKLAARRRVAATRAGKERRRPVCPTCHLELPLSGQCDTCL
jgi:hypothetical protein